MNSLNQTVVGARSDPDFVARITTRDPEAAKRIFAEQGVCIIPGVLSPDRVQAIRARLFADTAGDEAKGVLYRGAPGSDFDNRNIRIANLPNKGALFMDLLGDAIARDFIRVFMGDQALLSSFTANVPGPGAGGMGWHTDQGYVPRPWSPYPIAMNLLWAIDRSTFDNGATWVVPGSHLYDHGPALEGHYDAVAVEAPPGAMYVLDGRMWHRTGTNRTVDEQRTVLLAYFCRSYIRTQVDWRSALDPEVREGLTPWQRDLFGLSYNPTNDIGVWDDRNAAVQASASGS